ncbi:tetratricopeptide repeat protein [Roseofilum casamattae]|uniref:Tetratricopeptide repeat protein n=1 Tax=Roseofilum casamattae BLCC-M143 TaxID=3022442 RepID=A0ABT7C2Z4_9CYAN|nr:tetratricopeptide repeat protein [Roseofilum casamattae]MDJ1185835.1 tetratricopeptide repeat protein [Roseofilum casamattae BLCC-M143]
MNQQQFQQIYNHLTDRRQDVLNRIVAGETDKQIAEALSIGTATVRKHIERITEAFGLGIATNGQRRSKRSDLVSLVAQFKPELLKSFGNTTPPLLPRMESASILDVLQEIQPIQSIHNRLEPKLQYLQTSGKDSQKNQIGKRLKKTGYDSYMQGDFQGTIFFLEWALKFKASSPALYYNLGSAYEKMGDLDNSYRYYKQAAQSDDRPAHAAISNLARLDILKNNPEKAINAIEEILEQVSDPALVSSLYKNLGWAYFLQEDYEKAERYLRQAIQLNGERAAPYCLLAQVLEAKDNLQEAKLYWQKCLELDSSQVRPVGAPWRSPELDLWQQQARQSLDLVEDDHSEDRSSELVEMALLPH